jgi:glycosyltransferase involved in cell wall biosynthesis
VKIVILSQYYVPEIGAPQARLSALAKRFVARGHDVTVVTAMPNYPEGRIHDGYGGVIRRETIEGASTIRTYVYPTQRTTMVPRMLSYLSFAASASLVAPWFLGGADYLLVESPPLFLGPAAWWLSLRTRARLIVNVSDLWPESAVRLGVIDRQSRAFRAASWIEAFCYARAALVTAQSRSIVADIRRRFPLVETLLLSNGVDTGQFDPRRRTNEARRMLGALDEFVVLYAGLHGLAQGLDQLLAAAARLGGERRVRFVLAGDGPEKARLQAAASDRNLRNVTFVPPRPFAEMPALLASSDVVAVSLKTDIPGAVPSKLYEAMASGRPVLFIGAGEGAEIVRQHDAGVVVAPGDIDGLAAAILNLRQDRAAADAYGRAGRAAVTQLFDRTIIGDRFVADLEARLAFAGHATEVPSVAP